MPASGLALWLKADAGVSGSPVSQWSDQSVNARNATQATGGSQPALVATAINGLPAVRFDGVNDFLTYNLPVNSLAGMTMVLVAANTANPVGVPGPQNAALFWNETDPWGAVYLSPFQDEVNFRFGTTQVSNNLVYLRPVSVSSFTLTTAIKDGTTETLYVNGIQRLSQGGKLAAVAGAEDTGNLGRGYDDNTYFAGDIAEVLVYDRALTAAERRNLEAYLDSKYALTTPAAPQIFTQAKTNAAVGYLYQYPVNAEGSPAPFFTLSQAPAGMTLDGNSGVLSWTPTIGDVGDHLVTVNATNIMGTNSQTFTVRVRQLPAGLVSYWPLDETSGTGFRDLMDVNDAACVAPSCPLPGAGQVNGGQVFDDDPITKISAPTHPSLDFANTESFSLEAWVKTDRAAEVTYFGRLDSNDTLEYSIGHDVAGRPWFYLRDSLGNRITNLIAPSVAPFNQWHHVVGVLDAGAQEARIYVDGVLANTKSTAGVFTGSFSSPTAQMDIGWLNLHGGYHLRGTLDEVALYRRALGASEIANHYANGLAGIGIAGGTTNSAPEVGNPVANQPGTYGTGFNFQFAANTFTDPNSDPLTYTASGMPLGIGFTAATRTFAGTPTQVGVFPVAVIANDPGNLKATNIFNITITPATLTVAANLQSKVYGAADPALSYTVGGLQAGDTEATVLTGALTRAAGEAVGGYAISQGTLAANANYALSFTGNTLNITPAPPTILSLAVVDPTHVVITWSALSNATYRVQARSDMNGVWVDLVPDVTATNATASAMDNSNGDGQRFYRLLVVP